MSAREESGQRPQSRRRGGPFTYRRGVVSIAQGSTVLRGLGTGWADLSAKGLPNMPISGRIVLEGANAAYEVHLVNADELITLKRPFAEQSVKEVAYTYIEDSMSGEPSVKPELQAPPEAEVPVAVAAPQTPAAPAPKTDDRAQGALGEVVRTIGYALLIALVIRAFLFQPFNIPSSSMVPTLLVGDYIFVSKFAYGYSRHSLPLSPHIFSGRIFGSVPNRGDVVVFKLPSDGRTDYIKRVIGLPGDRIQVTGGVLYINGEPVKRERVQDFDLRDSLGNVRRAPMYRETLPNGVSYMTLDTERDGSYDNTNEYVVPKGHLFMMGDNRDNSMDSRAAPNYQIPRAGGVGYVPIENLVGQANVIFFSTDGTARLWEIWRWPQATRWGRLFDGVG